jgi:hypothetical protein
MNGDFNSEFTRIKMKHQHDETVNEFFKCCLLKSRTDNKQENCGTNNLRCKLFDTAFGVRWKLGWSRAIGLILSHTRRISFKIIKKTTLPLSFSGNRWAVAALLELGQISDFCFEFYLLKVFFLLLKVQITRIPLLIFG